jgi:hypothetical protein
MSRADVPCAGVAQDVLVRAALPRGLRTSVSPTAIASPMLQNIDLRKLAEVQGNGRDIVSAYFQGGEGLKRLALRERKLRSILADDPLEAENFERSMEMIRKFLEETPIPADEHVCVFSSAVLDFIRGFAIALNVADQLYVGPAPYIRPLAELQDEYETFALVVCDNERARILAVTNEKAEVEEAIRGGVKNHVRKGGWSQQRYERRRDGQLARYAKEVAAALAEMVTQQSIRRVVLLGSSETMQAIDAELNDSLREQVVGREPFDLHRGEEEAIERAYESYFDDERSAEQDLWQRIKSEVMRGGRAVAGPAEVMEQSRAGRVEAAIVTRDAKITAAACRDCEHVQAMPDEKRPESGGESSGAGPASETDAHPNVKCGSCGSENTFPVDLVDALARQLELTSATLNFVDPLPGLTDAGDVAALLRY